MPHGFFTRLDLGGTFLTSIVPVFGFVPGFVLGLRRGDGDGDGGGGGGGGGGSRRSMMTATTSATTIAAPPVSIHNGRTPQ